MINILVEQAECREPACLEKACFHCQGCTAECCWDHSRILIPQTDGEREWKTIASMYCVICKALMEAVGADDIRPNRGLKG